MTRRDSVIFEYVQWKLKRNEVVEQRYLNYLNNLGLLEAAIRGDKI